MKISVVICTHNRKEDLRTTLKGFYRQNYDDFEIIVIDNASTDRTQDMVVNEFQEVRFIYLPVNIDILAQNIGIYHAEGEIIWRTDSDSHPEDENTFKKVVEIFNNKPDIHIISTTEVLVKKNNRGVIPSNMIKEDGDEENGYLVKSFSGPGSAIRKEVFDKIGGYWEFGVEELDFSIRAMREGYNIRYFPKIRTLHFSSDSERNRDERWIKLSNQLMRIIVKYYPMKKLYNVPACYFFQMLLGIYKLYSFRAILQNSFQLVATVFSTWRNERVALNKEETEKILKGNEYFTGMMHIIKENLK